MRAALCFVVLCVVLPIQGLWDFTFVDVPLIASIANNNQESALLSWVIEPTGFRTRMTVNKHVTWAIFGLYQGDSDEADLNIAIFDYKHNSTVASDGYLYSYYYFWRQVSFDSVLGGSDNIMAFGGGFSGTKSIVYAQKVNSAKLKYDMYDVPIQKEGFQRIVFGWGTNKIEETTVDASTLSLMSCSINFHTGETKGCTHATKIQN